MLAHLYALVMGTTPVLVDAGPLKWDSDLRRPYAEMKTTQVVAATIDNRVELLWLYFTADHKKKFE